MSIGDILPELQALSRPEKLQLARMLLEELGDDPQLVFKPGQVFPIHTPAYAPQAAAQLAQVLRDRNPAS